MNMPAPILLQAPDLHHEITGVSPPSRVVVTMTSHNRREKTMACLQALSASRCVGQVALNAVLADDGSTDGTVEAVSQVYCWVHVEYGDGTLFWCRGMHRAFEIALQHDFDYYLWLNDDTMLNSDALSRLLDCAVTQRAITGKPVIVVGSTVDEETGEPTYGGERCASWWRRTNFVMVQPSNLAQPCDSMDGNIVLIPVETARLVGNIDPVFEHAMGDTDYGLRALKLGVGIWVAPGVYGACGNNPALNTFMDKRLPLSKRMRLMLGRKGLPWRSWIVFTRRHTGIFWPLFFLWPYMRTLLGGAMYSFKSKMSK